MTQVCASLFLLSMPLPKWAALGVEGELVVVVMEPAVPSNVRRAPIIRLAVTPAGSSAAAARESASITQICVGVLVRAAAAAAQPNPGGLDVVGCTC